MNTTLISIVTALLYCGPAFGQDHQASESAGKPDHAPTPAARDTSWPAAAELETIFKATLTKATMTGRWCSVKDGALGPEKEDKYTILGVTKLGGDTWIINARIQYGNNKGIYVPVPVLVKWAGDTPVIIVDKVPIPGGGVYSARVLIYEHTYAGTWTGRDHSGLLKGVITNEPADQPSETK